MILASTLLSLLFSFLTQSAKVEKSLESAHSIVIGRQHLQMRLQDIFMNLRITEKSPLYTYHFPDEKQTSLILSCDNGIDREPLYGGAVTVKLYVDEENNFCLTFWPNENEKEKSIPWRKEILFPKVSDCLFEFLGEKKKTTDRSVTSALAWNQSWEKGRTEIPSQVRLRIQDESGEMLQFAFFIPLPEPIITYWEGKKS